MVPLIPSIADAKRAAGASFINARFKFGVPARQVTPIHGGGPKASSLFLSAISCAGSAGIAKADGVPVFPNSASRKGKSPAETI